jgi:hypothetical protein
MLRYRRSPLSRTQKAKATWSTTTRRQRWPLRRANDKIARPPRAATHAKNPFGVRLFKD